MQLATPGRELTYHSVTCHPAEATFPPRPRPNKAGTGTLFSVPIGMQG